MKMFFIFIFLFLMSGCSALASREAFVVCQALDIATTARALHLSAYAYETNVIPIPILYALKVALMVYVWNSDWNKDESTELLRIGVNLLSCAPIPGNLQAAK